VLLAVVQVGCATQTAPSRAAGTPSAHGGLAAQTSRDLDLGRAALGTGDLTAATIRLREALRAEPDLPEARESLARALYAMGDLDGAVEELRALLRRQPDAVRARYFLATALMAKQDWPAARRQLDEVVRRQPDLVEAHYSLGLVRYTQGDTAGAIESFRQVLARSPDHADAHYNLALVLKVIHRDAEATPEFLAAARSGHAGAQYFAGAAYARGSGVEPSLTQAIGWWSRAAAQGSTEAAAALAELRQTALGRGRPGATSRQAAESAFRDYRAGMWSEFPELTRTGDDDPVGAALLRQGRGREAVPVLIREASALSEPAQSALEAIYLRGVDGQVPAHDGRILDYFKTAADEGQPRAQRLLKELQAASEAAPAPARP
jgi:Tfp pilus assembly protein PilF